MAIKRAHTERGIGRRWCRGHRARGDEGQLSVAKNDDDNEVRVATS